MKDKLMFIDIDGTFSYDSIGVAQEDLTAYRQIHTQYLTAIITGRSIKEIEFIERENQLALDYKIGFNGALIVDKQHQILFDQPIDQTMLIKLVDFLKKAHLVFDALDGEHRFGNFAHENKQQLLGLEYQYMTNPFDFIRNKQIYKVNVRPTSLEQATQITNNLKTLLPSLSIFRVGKKRIEISAAATSKGRALTLLKQKNKGQTVAIGDSENDISMFECADISYCMAHAPEYVRRKADFVVPRFRDAVAHLKENQE